MYKSGEYLEEDFIIFNSKLGVRDFVTIGKIETTSDSAKAWLDEPYEMVGPFCLDELITTGEISFAACVVMSKQRWKDSQDTLLKESFKYQFQSQQQFQEEIKKYNKKRRKYHKNLEQDSEEQHRKLLSLPLKGELEVLQIKNAFRKIAKTAHPDVGGTHEVFIKVTQARDILLEKYSL